LRIFQLLALAAATAASFACVAPAPAPTPEERLLRRASRVFDGRTAKEIGWEAALARAAAADAVFLGETHLDRLTHAAELAFLRGLASLRGDHVALALEMFERDVQPALDAYLSGEISEADFLAQARPWPNYRTDYRPMVEFARARGIPVIASNLPADLRRKLARGGAEAHAGLSAAERALMPARLLENPPEYWARVEQATLGHGALGMVSAQSRLYDGQNLWDNAMGDSVARARAEDSGRLVVHVNGGFHSAEWQGTVWQLQQRMPRTRVVTVAIETTTDLAGARPTGLFPEADVLLIVESRARSMDSGVRAATVAREHEFRLRIPPATAAPPLLIWLCDEGQNAEDALRLWQPVLAEEAAILALEPSFPYLGEDGIAAGRWFFPGKADEGGGLALAAFARALEEAQLPGLGLDASRVVLAGEGAGATMAVFAARYAREQDFHTLAFAAAARDEFALMSLPLHLPADRPSRELTLHDSAQALENWRAFAESHDALRLTTSFAELPDEPARQDAEQIRAVRAALGLPPPVANPAADELLRTAPDHPRARLLARVLARRARGAGLATAPSLDIRAADFADGARLPLSSGAFGGTTIVILPADASAAQIEEWLRLEDPDVIQQRSRFHRLRIAHGDGERTPRAVIERLRAENAQRRDFLLVPAVFCAGPDEMRALRAGLGPLTQELRLEFLSGLGDRMELASE
jgi:uncharacterized iron-regulated protein/predicted esterase